jgi:hypothetical protein
MTGTNQGQRRPGGPDGDESAGPRHVADGSGEIV